MSLDIYLTRKLGNYRELSNEQKAKLHRDYSDHLKWDIEKQSFEDWYKENAVEEVYDANITHNLNTMASKAGIYYALWHPYMINKSKAKELIPYLEKGLKYLKSAPEKYKKHDSPNGWGLYIHFVPFVEGVLNACKEYPDADVVTST